MIIPSKVNKSNPSVYFLLPKLEQNNAVLPSARSWNLEKEAKRNYIVLVICKPSVTESTVFIGVEKWVKKGVNLKVKRKKKCAQGNHKNFKKHTF